MPKWHVFFLQVLLRIFSRKHINNFAVVVIIVYIFIVLIILFLLSLTYVSADINIHRIKEDDNILINLSLLFGLVKLKFNIPYIDFVLDRNLKMGLKIKRKVDTKKRRDMLKAKERLSFEYILNEYQRFKDLKLQYESIFVYIIRKVTLEYFKWHTRLGLGDAALTAIVSGLFWSVKSNLLCLMSTYVSPEQVDVNIYPEYSEPIFETEIRCIIRIKIANIIIAGLKIIYLASKKVLLRRGGGNERTSYSGADENYNG